MFLRHLQAINEPAIKERAATVSDPPLSDEFCQWMRVQRGTNELTLKNYRIPIRGLLRACGQPQRLDARRLRRFVLKQSRGTSRWVAQRCATALRMFLRFLIANGRCRAGLLGAVPVVAHWRLAALPRYLPPGDIERLIDSCKPSSPTGKRERTIPLLLARLGLRASNIVHMRLQDIDWKGAWLHVAGKGRRQTRLPLSQEVASTLAHRCRYRVGASIPLLTLRTFQIN